MAQPKIQVAPYTLILVAGSTKVATDLHNIGTLKGMTIIFPEVEANAPSAPMTATIAVIDNQGVELFKSDPLPRGKHYVTPTGFVPCYERFQVVIELSEPLDEVCTFQSSIFIVF